MECFCKEPDTLQKFPMNCPTFLYFEVSGWRGPWIIRCSPFYLLCKYWCWKINSVDAEGTGSQISRCESEWCVHWETFKKDWSLPWWPSSLTSLTKNVCCELTTQGIVGGTGAKNYDNETGKLMGRGQKLWGRVSKGREVVPHVRHLF